MITVITGMACFDHRQSTALSAMHHPLPSCAACSPPRTGSIIDAVKPIANRMITAAAIASRAPRSMVRLLRVVRKRAVCSSSDGNKVREHERSIGLAGDRADDRALDRAGGTPAALKQAPRRAASERDSTASAYLLAKWYQWDNERQQRGVNENQSCREGVDSGFFQSLAQLSLLVPFDAARCVAAHCKKN